MNVDHSLQIAAAISVLLVAMSGCSGHKGTAVLGEVLAVEDDQVSPSTAPSAQAEEPLKTAQKISAGEHLRVPPGKIVTICFIPGAMAVAFDAAEIEVKELRIKKDGNETDDAMKAREVRLQLDVGSLTVLLDSKQIAMSPYVTIATAAGTLSADFDALFYIKSGRNHTRVTCVRGEVDLQDNNGRNLVKVGAGQWCDWRKGELPEPQPVTSSPQAPQEITAALQAEKKMATPFTEKQKAGPPSARP